MLKILNNKKPNPIAPRAVGSANGYRKSSFTTERQREIDRENDRLLRVSHII